MVKKKNRSRYVKNSGEINASHSHEKILAALFGILVILSVIAVLNTTPEGMFNLPLSGFLGKDILLEKNSYSGSEALKGTVALTMDTQDIIPANSSMTFSILTNSNKCKTKYVCSNGVLVDWYVINATTGTCDLLRADPEGFCCTRSVGNCTQVILNHEFDAGLESWSRSPPSDAIIRVEDVSWLNETSEEIVTSKALIEDSSGVTTLSNSTIKVYQMLSTRAIPISSLIGWTSQGGTGNSQGLTGSEYDVQDGQSQPGGTPNESYQSLIGKIAWQPVLDIEGCAFEIVVKSNSTRNMHYYYNLNLPGTVCYHPASENATDIYLTRSLEPFGDELVWSEFREAVYKDWKEFSVGGNDFITEVQVVSYRKKVGEIYYGQKLVLDFLDLRKGNYRAMGTNCTALGKKCCEQGTGFGSFLGEQLECPERYECWSSCANSTTMKFTSFISKSSSSSKKNLTRGEQCQAIVDGTIVPLKDMCYPTNEGGVGQGYTACLGNTTSGTCANWDNTYRVNLSSSGINLRAPNQNGTYTLKWRFEYNVTQGEPCYDDSDPEKDPIQIPCLIFEKTASFTVGSVSACVPNWTVINVSECVGNAQLILEEDMARCPENAPSYRRNLSQPCGTGGCTPGAYQCAGTIYQQCSQDGTTWTNVNDCATTSQLCDVAQNGCYTPCTPNCVGVACNGNDGCGGICIENCKEGGKIPWMIIIIVVVVIVVILILILALKKKKPKVDYSQTSQMGSQQFGSQQMQGPVNSQYPEVVSYIKDAVAAGATKPDIKAKLLEAGWPDDAIEQSFRDVGM